MSGDLTLDDFTRLARQLARLNDLDFDSAAAIIADVGDSPGEIDEDGRVVRRNETGDVVGRYAWPWEDGDD